MAFLNQKNYPWKKATGNNPQDMYVDIVVSDGTEYVPVELKYKTKKTKGLHLPIFGNNIMTVNLKDQSAQDLGRYDFWKDVHRLEVLKNVFKPANLNGIAIFLTNDQAYLNAAKQGTNCQNFYMSDGKGKNSFTKDINCHWMNGSESNYRPNFCLDTIKKLNWFQCLQSHSIAFYCAIVEV